MDSVERYIHHGEAVAVKSHLKGKHREHCLCYECEQFKPGSEENCRRAALLYAFCRAMNMVTPVWECIDFELMQDIECASNEPLNSDTSTFCDPLG